MRYLVLSLLLALPLGGCNLGPSGGGDDDDDSTGDDDDDDSSPTQALATTIPEIMAGDVEVETGVVVRGVVTTRWWNDEGDNQAGFWIQDGEGPGTGILVFTFFDVSVEADEANAFRAGDEVEVTGIYRRPFDFGEIVIDAVSDVRVLGQSDLPEPWVVDAADIEAGFAPDDLIGVLVSIEGPTVDASPGWNNYFEWEADGVIVDAPLFDGDAWTYPDVWDGWSLDHVSGVLHRDFGDAKILTRWTADVDYTRPGCNAAWTGTDTLRAVRCNTAPGTEVTIGDLVVISGEARIANAFFVQDPAAPTYGGIEIFSFDDLTIPEIGDSIEVTGELSLYNGQAEIIVSGDADLDVGPAVAATPVDVAGACDIGEAHEGMLVRIASVNVEAQDSDGEDFGYHTVAGCPLIHVAGFFFDEASDFSAATGGGAGEVVNLVGVVTDYYNEYAINPRSADDWDSWGD
jgi:DNA/RNA endonuclease YhcR with UshA esterase domain